MVSCIHLFQLQQDELKGKLDVYYLREGKIADMWTRETAKFIHTLFYVLCFFFFFLDYEVVFPRSTNSSNKFLDPQIHDVNTFL